MPTFARISSRWLVLEALPLSCHSRALVGRLLEPSASFVPTLASPKLAPAERTRRPSRASRAPLHLASRRPRPETARGARLRRAGANRWPLSRKSVVVVVAVADDRAHCECVIRTAGRLALDHLAGSSCAQVRAARAIRSLTTARVSAAPMQRNETNSTDNHGAGTQTELLEKAARWGARAHSQRGTSGQLNWRPAPHLPAPSPRAAAFIADAHR